ncbi:D-isomer specific 2-hydroxyacid dehydrogenase family protein [Corynebacterium caspium]|uniref:D-isomer specific 2-hydroxyacid dehydrogenase family protein n=1 Tax=Corynebacterium caspium TaxID=234828 RepID=UPI00036608C4|nr:D-isomer specific 2-hydroxyacid dehydrogenase family protein [Corynebacterium caspium]WKD58852.1 D-specific alpha-keto acid dehydrogenase [Corynebacterium caspium DSM 44850]
MKFTMQPTPWSQIVSEVAAAGHEYVADINDADFLIFAGGGTDFPELPSNIKFVQTMFAGLDALREAGKLTDKVRWANAAGLYADSVAESTLGLMLGAGHRYKQIIQASNWEINKELHQTTDFLGPALGRKAKITIYGAGGIAKRLIELLALFGGEITAINNSGTAVAGAARTVAASAVSTGGDGAGLQDPAIADADYLVLLAPLTPATYHLVNAEFLAAMKPSAFLINTGRGPLVDTPALITALETGQIAGAALDVTDPEPLPADHKLWQLPNVLITPHVANTEASMQVALGPLTVENARLFAAGKKMSTEVNIAAGY